jgi:gas vesicle protein
MKSDKLLLGLLAGFASGALLGVLLAPDKGSATRKKINKKGDEVADKLKVKFNEYVDTISHKIDDSNYEKYTENLKEKFNEFLGIISDKVENIKAGTSGHTAPKNTKSKDSEN